MFVSIIAATSTNRVIGLSNAIPWRLPADLKRFKTLTMGHHLLMGRKTFESIGRPLPGRTTVVMTRRRDYSAPGILVAHSLDEALELARGDDEIFVAGGADIYRLALPSAQRLYQTLIHEEFPGDTFFPEFDESTWHLVWSREVEADERNPHRFTFQVYEKIPSQSP